MVLFIYFFISICAFKKTIFDRLNIYKFKLTATALQLTTTLLIGQHLLVVLHVVIFSYLS